MASFNQLCCSQIPSNSTANWPRQNRCPDEFIQSLGSLSIPNQDEWVSARFSPHPLQEDIFAMGSENGTINICNAKWAFDKRLFYRSLLQGPHSVVFDLQFIPDIQNWLVSLSGSSQLILWDLEIGKSIYTMIGHGNSVRCASVWPENPFLLVSGSRDGSIMAWDLRTSPNECFVSTRILKQLSIGPTRGYYLPREEVESAQKLSVTGLLHIGNENVISASSSTSSGILQWDMRYIISPGPVRTWTVPQRMAKESGVTSLSWDRHKSSFFASCTDNAIYEYMPSVQSRLPVRTLIGQDIDSFYVQCATSPISDHLLCGSSNRRAYIWDLQESRKYRLDKNAENRPRYLPGPKFALDGFEELETVQWSSQANCILTLGRDSLQIWRRWAGKGEGGHPEELEFDDVHRGKLHYPRRLEPRPRRDGQLVAKQQFGGADERITLGMGGQKQLLHRSPLKMMLGNLPNSYNIIRLARPADEYRMRTPRKIVIKGNTFVTPARKIPSTESHEDSSARKTPRRNLTISLQRQITPGSSARKRKRRVNSPSSSGKREPKVSGSRRSLQRNIPKSSTPSQPHNQGGISSTTASSSILNYFSPSAEASSNNRGEGGSKQNTTGGGSK